MRFKLALVLPLAGLIALFAGCGGKKTVFPDGPAVACGTTDSEGRVDITIGPYIVQMEFQNQSLMALPGINVTCYLLHEHLLSIASAANGSYYPAIELTSFEEAQSNSRPGVYGYSSGINSTARRDTEIPVTLIMEGAGLAAYGYDVEPADFDLIRSDGWVATSSEELDMETFYQNLDSVAYQGAAFVNLSSDVALTAGAGRETASFMLDGITDFATFSSLMSLELRIFSGDTVNTIVMDYLEGSLPILMVDDIIMNRDFWIQFTLTWGENPGDLDSHIWTPDIEGVSYHIYFASRGNAESAPFVDLDVDDVTSYGPEHITVWNEHPGTYTYAIYHYSGSGTITASEAEVGILKPDGTVQLYYVPEGTALANWWWHVCTIDGETGEITPINIISADPPSQFTFPEGNVKPYAH